MSEKALLIAKEKIIGVVLKNMPQLSYDEASALSDQILSEIDWNDPALMHKDLEWIATFFLKNRVVFKRQFLI